MATTNMENELTLTPDDTDLFRLDDQALQAKALEHDLMPRLEQVLQQGLDLILEMYGDDPLAKNTIFRSPNYRREDQVKEVYYTNMGCHVGLLGKRAAWPVDPGKSHGERPKQLPIGLQFGFGPDGASLLLSLYGCGPIPGSRVRMLEFLLQHWSRISTMGLGMGWGLPHDIHGLGGAYADHEEYLRKEFLGEEEPNLLFGNWNVPLPVEGESLKDLVNEFANFWPLYSSMVSISREEEPQFLEKVVQLNAFIKARDAAEMAGMERSLGSPS